MLANLPSVYFGRGDQDCDPSGKQALIAQTGSGGEIAKLAKGPLSVRRESGEHQNIASICITSSISFLPLQVVLLLSTFV